MAKNQNTDTCKKKILDLVTKIPKCYPEWDHTKTVAFKNSARVAMQEARKDSPREAVIQERLADLERYYR